MSTQPAPTPEATLAAAVRKAGRLRAQLAQVEADRDRAIAALRSEGHTLADIADRARLSSPGVLKVLRRQGTS